MTPIQIDWRDGLLCVGVLLIGLSVYQAMGLEALLGYCGAVMVCWAIAASAIQARKE